MAKDEKSINISAPPAKIFEYINVPTNLPEIWPSMVEAKDVEPLPNGGNSFRWVYKMAGMRFEGGDLELNGAGDIHPHVGLLVARHVHLLDAMRGSELGPEQRHLAGRRHGVDGRLRRSPVVRMVDVSIAREQGRRIPGKHHLGLMLADHMHQVAPKVQRGLQLAIVVAQELHLGHSQDGAGGALLGAADLGQPLTRHARLVGARIAIGADDVGHLAAGRRPGRHRAGHGELGIVRVSDNDHR